MVLTLQAHDDFYVIDYAVKHDGFIVTTDMFRDHVSNRVSDLVNVLADSFHQLKLLACVYISASSTARR